MNATMFSSSYNLFKACPLTQERIMKSDEGFSPSSNTEDPEVLPSEATGKPLWSTAGVTEWRVKLLPSKTSGEELRTTFKGEANVGVDTKSPKALSDRSSLPVAEGGPELKPSGEILVVMDSSAESHSVWRVFSWGGRKRLNHIIEKRNT